MKRRSLWLLLGVIGLVALMASSSAMAGKKVTPRTGGTVIYGLDQEPKVLNTYITEGNLFAASEATEPLLDGGMEYNNRGVLVPVLMSSERVISWNSVSSPSSSARSSMTSATCLFCFSASAVRL